MCGICGFIDSRTPDEKHEILSGMMRAIAHRGPDSDGMHVDERGALGFRRLSIVDLHSGDQPIYNEDHTLAITFNGEIYNYQGLRTILIQLGHTFTTHTDTEVLLHGYEEWGTDLLHKIRGMFAFVIWNMQTGELFGARDRFGIKPLYYMHDGDMFMYASEIKSMLQHPDFKKQVNADALRAYMTFQYPPLNETFFKGVFQLQQGHYFVFRNGHMDIQQWWDPQYAESRQPLNEIVDGIDKEVIDSVDAHSIADVEVGAFLSSGVDSSYVAAIAHPKHTYSIGFDTGKFNESKIAADFAGKLGLSNTARSIHASEAFEKFPQIIWHLDEPDANPSCVPLYFLSELASRDVKVVLSGEGADELFAGYQTYGFMTRSKTIRVVTQILGKLPKRARYALAHFVRNKRFPGKTHIYENLAPAEEWFIGDAKVFDDDEARALLKPAYRNGPSAHDIVSRIYRRIAHGNLSDLKKKQYLDMHQWMPGDILLKADKMSMAHSLELRVPLLDEKVMDVAEQVPTKYLMNSVNTKYAFRCAAGKHLPEQWAWREKLGFPVPIKSWLREKKYYLYVRSIFERAYAAEFFDQQAILTMLDDNYAGRTNDRRKIWTIFTFLVWYDVFFIHDGSKPADVVIE